MIYHYLKTAFRSLQRNKLYFVLIIGGFAVGFTVCIIIGLYAYNEFSVDTGIKDHERVYRLVDVDSKFFNGKTTAFDYNLGNILTNNYSEIEHVAPYRISSSNNAYELMQKWLENFAYKTTLDWWIFALAGLGTLAFVVTIVTLQSWNTARRNPIETLRYE